MTETPESPEQQRQKAHEISDALAQARTANYPNEFLAELQDQDPTLFNEFLNLKDFDGTQDETNRLLAEMDSALRDWETYKKAEETINQLESTVEKALDPIKQFKALNINDNRWKTLSQLILDRPLSFGEVYWNPVLLRKGVTPSADNDHRIVRDIQRDFPHVSDLLTAYSEVLMNPNKTREEIRWVKQAVDFIIMKALYLSKSQNMSAQAKAGRMVELEKLEEFESLKEKHEPVVFVNLEEITEYDAELGKSLRSEYQEAIDAGDPDEYEAIVNKIQMEWETMFPEKVPEEAPPSLEEPSTTVVDLGTEEPTAAPAPEAAPASPASVPAVAAPPSAAPEAVAEAPKMSREEYRNDAKANPGKYCVRDTEKGTLKFKKEISREAELAIRIEDLFSKEEDRALVLTSSRYPELEFKFEQNGPKGPSWYAEKEGEKLQRLLIYKGDVITYKKPEIVVATNAPSSTTSAGEPAPAETPIEAGGKTADAEIINLTVAEAVPEIEAISKDLLALMTKERDLAKKASEAKASVAKARREGRKAFVDPDIEKSRLALAKSYETLQARLEKIDHDLINKATNERAWTLLQNAEKRVPIRLAELKKPIEEYYAGLGGSKAPGGEASSTTTT